MKAKRITTLTSWGTELSMASTSFCRPGKALTLLSGRSTRNTLIADIEGTSGMMLSKAVTTTMKSRTFQAFLKYVPCPRQNPCAITLRTNSIVKNAVKTGSDRYSSLFRHDPASEGSPTVLDAGSSSITDQSVKASTTELTRIRNRMNLSNQGWATTFTTLTRKGLSWPKMKREFFE